MKVLITGINGFIGRNLATELIKRGYFVIGVGRSKKCLVENVGMYYSGSVLDAKVVQKAIKDVDVVVHLAALTAHKDIIDNKFETLDINLHGTKNLLDVFIGSRTARKFIYSSTGKVYGDIKRLPIVERHPVNPLNILGKSKLVTERLIDFYADNQKEFIIFRIFNIYGPGQGKNFLVPTILEQIKNSKTEIVLGDIYAKRDYLYIDDLVNAFILAIEKKGRVGVSIYNICTGIGTSAGKIVKMISRITEMKIHIKSDSSLFRHDEMDKEYGSYILAKRELNWTPKIALAEGLAKLLQ